MGAIYGKRPIAIKVARWAKANPQKTRWLITALHFSLLVLGMIAGKNIKELGYEFSYFMPFVFAGIMFLGFLLSPFFPKPKIIAIPKEVERRRWGYLCIALSSLIIMAFWGNRIEDIYPNSPLTLAIERTDQFIFPDNAAPFIGLNKSAAQQDQGNHLKRSWAGRPSAMAAVFFVNPDSGMEKSGPSVVTPDKDFKKSVKAEKKAERKAKVEVRKMWRIVLAGGSCALAVFLIILLVITTCAGICLAIGGGGAIGGGNIGVGLLLILAGGLITYGSIAGISKLRKWCQRNRY